MLKIQIVISEENNHVGFPLYENGVMILCPKCNKGHLFVRKNNNKIECTYQPNCDYQTENK